MSSCPIFFCDPFEDKIVYTIQSRRSFCASPSCQSLGVAQEGSLLLLMIKSSIFCVSSAKTEGERYCRKNSSIEERPRDQQKQKFTICNTITGQLSALSVSLVTY
jgi:hypothetical protein